MIRFMRARFLLLAVCAVTLVSQNAAAQVEVICPTATTAACNPCDLFNRLVTLSILNALDEDLKAFIQLLSPDVSDIDGAFVIDDSGEALIASLTGDDIRDVSNTMEVMEFLIDNKASTSLSPELQALGAALDSALIANRIKLEEKLGPTAVSIFRLIAGPIIPALAWYTLLGTDEDFADIVSPDPIVTSGQGTLGVLQALLVLLNGVEISEGTTLGFADTVIRPGDFITFGEEFGANGDLDGDGASNICEYRHFKRNLCSASFTPVAPFDDGTSTYLQAVLNPALVPNGCYEVESATDECRIALSADQVVPPNTTEGLGEVRYRRFENTLTGAERYQINFLHTLQVVTPVARIKKGRPGQVTDTVYLEIPVATPRFWEVYITTELAATLKANSNYFEITGFSSDTPPEPQEIRGDNNCGVLAPPPPVPHVADLNEDFIIQDTEILPLIEYINTGGLRCDGAGGFLAGLGDQNCDPHDSDYNPQDWKINLPELLRLVQLFTAGSYEECIGGSEDGYCITVN